MKRPLLNIVLSVAAAALLSCSFHLDGPDDHSAERDMADAIDLAQKAADVEVRLERAAAQLCVKLKGPNAGHRWTEDHRLVCTTNKGRDPVIAGGTL